MPHPAISYRIFLGNIPYLKNGSLQRTYIMYNRIVYRANSIKSDSQAHHIKLCIRETLDSCRITDMTENLMREGSLQFLRAFLEQFNLPASESVELRRITSHKMREYRTGDHRTLILQSTDEQWNIFHCKAEPMHTSIEFHVNGEVGDSFFLRSFDKCVEQMKIIDFRFQLIIEHGFECRKLRIHNYNRGGNTCFAKFGTFVSHGHSQIIDMVFLQALGYFVRTGSVSGCFHHTDHLCFRMAKHGTVMVQIGDHRSEVYFKDGFMHLQFKFFGYQIKVEHARTFYQNYFRMK